MAKAILIPEKTETIVKVVEPKKIVLELSEEEAVFLTTICGQVLGSAETSPRKHASAIFNTLLYEAKSHYKRVSSNDVNINLRNYNLNWVKTC